MEKELEYINYCIAENKCRINKLDTMGFTADFKKQYGDYLFKERERLNAIKQALTTKSKKEQALDIIVKKEVNLYKIRDFYGLKDFESYSSYNAYRKAFNFTNKEMLTEEEFNLIKEMLENDNPQE